MRSKHRFCIRKAIPLLATLSLLLIDCGDSSPFQKIDVPPPTLRGHLTRDLTLSPLDQPYLLDGYVIVDSPYTLTILPGTVIQGLPPDVDPTKVENLDALPLEDRPGALIVARGAKINAEGTKSAPIVFTSSKPAGSRAPADWGGLIINGQAPINNPDSDVIRAGEGSTGRYGGSNSRDNSGVLRYVRVEFAGVSFNSEKQLNGIALQGVGSGTQIDHIQVHKSDDDGIEFFGGTVNAKYLLCTGSSDDGFDWTDGWVGKGQFWIAAQIGAVSDRCIEADNRKGNPAVTPVSSPVLYNISLLGEEQLDKKAIHLRVGTNVHLYNSVISDFATGVVVDYQNNWNLFLSGTSDIGTTFFSNEKNFEFEPLDNPDSLLRAFFFDDTLRHNMVSNAVAPVVSLGSWDYRASAGLTSLLIPIRQPPIDGFFEPVDFIGAMGPDEEDNWVSGWITSSEN